ncbi:hypothetical protein C3489_07400 [Streptomyces sp. Ru71]|uniref:hypothetical protein n=1 Tax=Streptomyces sp. Ru71 TaxID=2080746 RepID=UPI000CDE51DD|nr:hypothetical protein [Streptomyces sp. Ru71]POX55977.1 hypothetical protein C3489_07400 [Streptomyces sp. Ru71]
MDRAEILALPFVDEHTVLVAAEPDAVWRGLREVVDRSFTRERWAVVVRLLGCADRSGFRVAGVDPGRELALVGRHRFSSYALVFRLDAVGAERTRVRAVTRARFPGPAGAVYRQLVIGSGGHALAVRRMLSAVRRSAPEGARASRRGA